MQCEYRKYWIRIRIRVFDLTKSENLLKCRVHTHTTFFIWNAKNMNDMIWKSNEFLQSTLQLNENLN